MEHITIDEIISFLQINELNKSNMKMINDFNQHIYQCSECRKNYTELSQLVESIDTYVNSINEKINLLQACFKIKDKSYSEIFSIFTNKIKNLSTEISVTIESMARISTANLFSGFSFYHPAMSGQLKSTNSMVNMEMEDVLIDDKYNKISISEDGTLSIFVQKDICEDDEIVFLIPEDDEQDVLIGHTKACSEKFSRAEFFDIVPGNYKIVF